MVEKQPLLRNIPILAAGLLTLAMVAPPPAAAAPVSNDSPQVKHAPQRSASSTRSSGSSSRARGSSSSSKGTASRSRSTATRSRSSNSGSAAKGRTRVERSDNYRRGRSSSRSYRGGYYGGYYGRSYYRGYYGPEFYYSPYGHYYRYPLFGYVGYYPSVYVGGSRAAVYESGDDWGALDMDVSPEKAEIFVDGQRIGVADDFDGFPSYLWLEEGTYDIVIYKDGYESIARQYTIYPGMVIDVEDDMVEGVSQRPEELISSSTVRRDDRLRDDRERAAELRMRNRESMDRDREDRNRNYDVRSAPARLALEITPIDAAVYLDGRFLGNGAELARLHSDLMIDPGEHTLEVVMPGYEDEVVEFTVDEGEEETLKVTLDRN